MDNPFDKKRLAGQEAIDLCAERSLPSCPVLVGEMSAAPLLVPPLLSLCSQAPYSVVCRLQHAGRAWHGNSAPANMILGLAPAKVFIKTS